MNSMNSGTSMAAPHVTGVCALVWSKSPNLSWRQVKNIVLQTARPVEGLERSCRAGGVVNAANAMSRILANYNSNGLSDGVEVGLYPRCRSGTSIVTFPIGPDQPVASVFNTPQAASVFRARRCKYFFDHVKKVCFIE